MSVARVLQYNDDEIPRDWTRWQGQTIDSKFELARYISGSEDSAVFLTAHGSPSKSAAIKIFLKDPANAQKQLEAWSLVQNLDHPHLIRIFASGQRSFEGSSFVYAVMEYADENLAMVLPSRPLTAEETRQMAMPVLDALAYIHGEGLVHGHIKPANIMVVDERVKVSSDSIIQRLSGQMPGLDQAWFKEIEGYLPPEAVREPAPPSGRAKSFAKSGGQQRGLAISQPWDVWSFGVVLVEALTQQKPSFNSFSDEAVLPASVPPPFRKIAEECLRTNPEQRATASQIRSELSRIQPFSSLHPVGQMQPGERKSAPGLLWALAGFVIFLAALWAGLFFRHHSQAPLAQPAVTAPAPESVPIAEVQPAPNSPGRVVQQALPDIPERARQTIQGTIRIRLRLSVDDSGNVETVKTVLSGPSAFFARKASEAARQWKFDPIVINGKPAASVWTLEFQMRRSGTTAHILSARG